ncbi:hypothetical protein BKA67DRAFT_531934 [Truncatella angustata]|uniref:DUF6604 domain-containing protein n=1 Tax=Truncatella angustata TaxID=152316 RepID=A0A9P9A152_9PEZI|nr:uncharacterized protein BKA67DRAFT_531934 [Truncatella angustata]KAH6656675.1 hypothetical protein BKA67DRAFT_531934 [Truncatella angustata]
MPNLVEQQFLAQSFVGKFEFLLAQANDWFRSENKNIFTCAACSCQGTITRRLTGPAAAQKVNQVQDTGGRPAETTESRRPDRSFVFVVRKASNIYAAPRTIVPVKLGCPKARLKGKARKQVQKTQQPVRPKEGKCTLAIKDFVPMAECNVKQADAKIQGYLPRTLDRVIEVRYTFVSKVGFMGQTVRYGK